jgi:hypothetical protein
MSLGVKNMTRVARKRKNGKDKRKNKKYTEKKNYIEQGEK